MMKKIFKGVSYIKGRHVSPLYNIFPVIKKEFFFKLILIPVLLSGCNNELDLVFEHAPIPIVYCVFNPADTAYFVSLTKSFQGDTNALYMARQPENLHFDSADIRLFGLGVVGDTIFETSFVPTERTKNPGIFTTASGFLYRSVKTIDQFTSIDLSGPYKNIARFKMEILIPGFEKRIESTILRIKPAAIGSPIFDNITFDFYSPDPPVISVGTGTGDYQDCIDFWIRLKYSDHFVDSIVPKTLDILFRRHITDYISARFILPPELFLNQLARHESSFDNRALYRSFSGMDFISYNGGPDYKRYIDSWVLTNSDYHMVDFSNLSNARGLFSMKNSFIKYNYRLNQRMKDSLAMSPRTSKLRFVRW